MRVANILLSHQPPEAVSRMLAYWWRYVPEESIFLIYGGRREAFERLDWDAKAFAEDRHLRTSDHQRERQSYFEVYRAALPWLKSTGAEYVRFAEFDEVPVRSDFNERAVERLQREKADVLGHHVLRVDGTNHPVGLAHQADPKVGAFWRGLSLRKDPEVMLSMLGCGAFWTREAFEAVCQVLDPPRIYLELFFPSTAHHLGFRVRGTEGQDRFMHPSILREPSDLEGLREQGAWMVHPVKSMWLASSAGRSSLSSETLSI